MNQRTGELKSLVALAIPVILSQVGNMSLNIVDTWVLGQYDSVELAGVAAGNGLFMPILVVSMGFLLGLDPLLTEASSRGDKEGISRVFSQSIILSILQGILISPFIYWGAQFFALSGADPQVVSTGEPYLRTLAYSFPLTLLFNAFQRYWQSMEIAVPITIIILLANVINLIADLVLVHGYGPVPAMGAEGVGWATFACRLFQVIGVIIVTWYLAQKRGKFFPPLVSMIRYHSATMKRLLRLSLPASMQIGLEVLAFNLVTIVIARVGPIPVAGHSIILSLASLTFMFPMGIANATAIRVGIHNGAGRSKECTEAGSLGIKLGALVMAFFGLMFLTFPEFLMGLFSSDQKVIDVALSVTTLVALFQIADGIQVTSAGALRGIGDTKSALYSNLISFYFIGLPVAIYLCFQREMGLKGLWIGLAVALVLIAIYNTYIWNRKRALLPQSSGSFKNVIS